MPLTPRQAEFLDFLGNFQREYGYAPKISQIQEYFGLSSPASVHQKLTELESEGMIRRHKNAHRGIEIIQWPKESDLPAVSSANRDRGELQIPLLGVIAAGNPISSFVQQEGLFVPADMYSPTRFAFKVRGESMKDEQISDGDYIVAEPTWNKHLQGKTVVASIGEGEETFETTVKKFFDERSHIRLQPANAAFEPIIIKPPQVVRIQGIVVGLIRKFM
ncbi:MAG TPA: transcriptional repressor LexA [Blastocatellia bacterium]|nr:transcriptional repressor LexA [Blastocatellia bacterium]HMV86628.1 transcriptional repressor LexA [Blastocatellia bacterium]HMX28358.1 transcriptional repressor LexA [Blastocatellia bacterium]HMY71193.1 transcriptional repressor LexA [Blastocatellia bacterium]HNG30795.1 transcriptional repressor LexA [Blastocatellia bacterium]